MGSQWFWLSCHKNGSLVPEMSSCSLISKLNSSNFVSMASIVAKVEIHYLDQERGLTVCVSAPVSQHEASVRFIHTRFGLVCSTETDGSAAADPAGPRAAGVLPSSHGCCWRPVVVCSAVLR